LFVEPNPIPIKWAMADLNMTPSGIRLPLTPLSGTHFSTLRAAMKQAEL